MKENSTKTMSKEIEETFKDGFELHTGKFYLNVIHILTRNEILLTQFVYYGLMLKEILNGKVGQELEETKKEKVLESLSKIDDLANQSYIKVLENILK